MPDFMEAETSAAFDLKDLDGYHIMRETFQWPLAMQGHLASYPLGLTLAAQLHKAAQGILGSELGVLDKGHQSPYFALMAQSVDAYGAEKPASWIIETATGQKFLDRAPLLRFLWDKSLIYA
jgi:Zn-dependent M32 family carboxypeptidase